MLAFIVYILTILIDIALFIKFINIFLTPKIFFTNAKNLTYIFIFIIFIKVLGYFIPFNFFNTMIHFLIYTIFIIKCYEGTLFKKILFTCIEPLSLGLLGFFIELFLYYLIGIPYPTTKSDLSYSSLRTFIIYIMLYTIISLLDIFKKKKNQNIKNPYGITIISIVMLNILFLISAVFYYRLADFTQKSFETLIIIILIGVMLIILSSIILYNSLIKHLQTEYNTRLQLQLNELQQDFYKRITESTRTLKSVRHDLKNHLIVIDGYLAKNKIEDARAYVKGISEMTTQANTIINTENIVLSSLLTQKKTTCLEKNISFFHQINLGNHSLPDSDLCIIISNILDNAIEASEQVLEHKGYIELEIDDSNEILSIHCTNNYSRPPVIEGGKFLSSKKNRFLHGIGLLNVEEIVKKYDGTMDYKFENYIFSMEILLKF